MKKKFTLTIAASLLLLLLASIESKAQQPETINYTYKVFQAPNKNYGYDIFQNGKMVYHEFASMSQPENINQPKNFSTSKSDKTNPAFNTSGNLALVKTEHAQKAALLSIEKMKRKEMPALSRDEIKNITAQ